MRESQPIHNHIEDCLRLLQNRRVGYAQFAGASFASYMTGLGYHKYEEKPEEHHCYVCLPDLGNKYDVNALSVLSDANKRIAFVPRDLCAHIAERYPDVRSRAWIVVAYCTGRCTPKSAQCIYNVFQILSAAPAPVAAPAFTSGQTCCTMCGQLADRHILPCKHFACCYSCIPSVQGCVCPSCRVLVIGTQPFMVDGRPTS